MDQLVLRWLDWSFISQSVHRSHWLFSPCTWVVPNLGFVLPVFLLWINVLQINLLQSVVLSLVEIWTGGVSRVSVCTLVRHWLHFPVIIFQEIFNILANIISFAFNRLVFLSFLHKGLLPLGHQVFLLFQNSIQNDRSLWVGDVLKSCWCSCECLRLLEFRILFNDWFMSELGFPVDRFRSRASIDIRYLGIHWVHIHLSRSLLFYIFSCPLIAESSLWFFFNRIFLDWLCFHIQQFSLLSLVKEVEIGRCNSHSFFFGWFARCLASVNMFAWWALGSGCLLLFLHTPLNAFHQLCDWRSFSLY